MNKYIVVFLLAFCVAACSCAGLNEEFSWTRITFDWPKKADVDSRSSYNNGGKGRQRTRPARPTSEDTGSSVMLEGQMNTGGSVSGVEKIPESIDYNYVNNIPMGANVWKNKLFMSIPRRRLGVPSTLNYVSLDSTERHNVPLKPYPSWETNMFPDATGNDENIISVYRTRIDECDRLWFVDTGIVETLGNKTYVRPNHRLVIIDLNTDQIIHRYAIPNSAITPASILASLTVEVSKESCDDAYAYFPDLAGYGVTVYSLKQDQAWRVNHNYFFVEPLSGEFSIAGYQFQWNDGVFSVELSDIKADGYRDMYFHSLSGTNMYKVSTRIMRNETLATRSYHENDFKVVGNRGPLSQTSTADIHKPSGTMFLGLINQNALGCWNINKPLETISIVQKDDNKMIYPSDVKVFEDKVYVLTNTMPGFIYGMLDYDKTNFRVWSNDVSNAIKGTMCEGLQNNENRGNSSNSSSNSNSGRGSRGSRGSRRH